MEREERVVSVWTVGGNEQALKAALLVSLQNRRDGRWMIP